MIIIFLILGVVAICISLLIGKYKYKGAVETLIDSRDAVNEISNQKEMQIQDNHDLQERLIQMEIYKTKAEITKSQFREKCDSLSEDISTYKEDIHKLKTKLFTVKELLKSKEDTKKFRDFINWFAYNDHIKVLEMHKTQLDKIGMGSEYAFTTNQYVDSKEHHKALLYIYTEKMNQYLSVKNTDKDLLNILNEE